MAERNTAYRDKVCSCCKDTTPFWTNSDCIKHRETYMEYLESMSVCDMTDMEAESYFGEIIK